MTKLCKQYLSEVKCFFSVYGKEEKKYLQKLSKSVDEFIEEENITNIEDIYEHFDSPHVVANAYFASIDTADYIQRTRINKWKKIGIVAIIIIALIGVSCYAAYKYNEYKLLEQNSVFLEEIDITE